VAGALSVAGWKQIKVLQVAAEHWTGTPLVPISSLLSNSLPGANAAIVRVQGKLRLVAPDQVLVEDQTGQIPVEGMQVPAEADGAGVELLGRLTQEGATAVFQSGASRTLAQGGGTDAPTLPVLTSAEQVKYLSREEASRKYPVKVRGVITSTIAWHESFVLQDATDGVFVEGIAGSIGHLRQLGDQFEVEGATDQADFAPVVHAGRLTYLGVGRMPEPIRPNRDQLVNGSLDAKYVELSGIVTAVAANGVTLLTHAGKYAVELPGYGSSELRPYENARIRIRGCLYAAWDQQTKQIRIGQIRIFNASFNVDEPAPADLFAAPARTPDELLRFDAAASAFKRIRVPGQIVHEHAGEYYMVNGTRGLRFYVRAPVPLKPGDLVEVVGFPELGGASPVIHEATARKTGSAPLPNAKLLSEETLLSVDHDAILVSLDSQLVGFRASPSEQILEMRAGARTYLARLDTRNGPVQPIPLGSRLRLTGAYSGRGGDRTEGRDVDSFELLLNSPADVAVLAHPSWWTPQRILMTAAALVVVLLLALMWISGLRRQVEHQTSKLKIEIEEHRRTEDKLAQRTQALESEIAERQRVEQEVERVHRELLTASHEAGMAEVATGVLHNVGNVLNSVNVSASLVAERLNASKSDGVARLARLLKEQGDGLARFLTEDGRGRTVPAYLEQLAAHLDQERAEAGKELAILMMNVEHINEIVAMQQNYARALGVVETVALADLVEDALKIHGGAYARRGINLVRDFEPLTSVSVDKHKVLQILVNLIQNAEHACDESAGPEKRVTIRLRASGPDRVRIEVTDTGVGIAPKNLTRIFSQGFTTRKGGHGFGLHSGALAAQELGGTLTVHSDGPGHGATFTLELPLSPGGLGARRSFGV
jgi:signal transduction histidine kinase